MVPRSIECQRCLHRNPADARYCSTCGQALSWELRCQAAINVRREIDVRTDQAAVFEARASDHAAAAESGIGFCDCMVIGLMAFSTLFVLTGGGISVLLLLAGGR